MARKATKQQETQQDTIAEPEQQIAQVCCTCRHWKPRPNWAFIGECMPSRNGLGQPLVTTDMQVCRAFEWRDDIA